MNGKNKLDLCWIVPELVAGVALSLSAIFYLAGLPSPREMGYWTWIFHAGLVACVIRTGLDWSDRALEALKMVKWK